jgi:hypothetical protein
VLEKAQLVDGSYFPWRSFRFPWRPTFLPEAIGEAPLRFELLPIARKRRRETLETSDPD